MTPVIWVHGDAMNPNAPTFRAYPQAPALWVWDEDLLATYNISLKRILFMYENLLEMPVAIRRGDVAAELARFAAEHDASTIATIFSPSPRFTQITDQLAYQDLTVEVWYQPPLVDPHRTFDLKRFSRYWRKAEKLAMQRTS
ncbi:MAG: deoxyribodipyrimidine photo-lyase [Chloroflexi bacterium]|nr:deoxyribodipyrimidine photo-lyase [Chloroflexota bacterium]